MGKSKRNTGQNRPKLAPKGLPPVVKQQISNHVDKLLQICGQPPPASSSQLWDEYLIIIEVLEKIEELERPIAIAPRNREDHFKDFMVWVSHHQEQPSKTSIALFDGQWGLRAENDIKQGELWLTIPKKLMMTLQTARQSPLDQLITNDPILSNLPQVALTLHLLHETFKADSFWEPYIKILPSEYNTVLYFTPDELSLLKGSPVYDESLKHIRHIGRQYGYFWRLFQKTTVPQLQVLASQFTYSAYRYQHAFRYHLAARSATKR